jgi:tetratricopeptide (TPR) repeat protein
MTDYIRWIKYLALSLLSGAVLSCAPIYSVSPTEEEGLTLLSEQSGEWSVERKVDRLGKAYANFAMASMLAKQGHPTEARSYLVKALEQDPDSVYLNQRMAFLLKELKDYEAAVRYAQKSIDLDPDDIENRVIIAEIYEVSGEKEAAIAEYEKILVYDPDLQRARIALASIFIREGQYLSALRHLDILIEQDPKILMAHYYRGRIHFELGNYVEAEKFYLEVLKLDDRVEPALFDLGSLYEQSPEKQEKAAEIYEKLLSYNPDDLLTRDRLIDVYYRLGREEMAQEQIEKIKGQTRAGEPLRRILGHIYLRHGRPEEAVAEFASILSVWPKDDKTRFYLAVAHEESKDDDEALRHYGLIRKESQLFVEAQIRTAYIFENQEKYDEAIERMRRVLEIDPNQTDALNYIGYTYAEQGRRLDEAMELIKRALEFEPESGMIIDSLGWVYYQKGQYDEALDSLEKAVSLEPDVPEIIEHLGDVYFKTTQYEKSLEMYQRALSLNHEDKDQLMRKIEETKKFLE